ncbi:DnaE-like error-prone DNA polymerase [Antricoccus suffuscus]|uniref:Error-prone DNA polymerase n=1 Tax=Antricoccus suffuscus TaxID=1629062 RepID=A0A2T0ZC39_9ACTN|nr:error-prone DNA polymerase [Antricoccus suffuscus]PRZ33907.1 DnaE-like error-prone DNA polymerase [Antricoccus suffuscus]
MGWSNPPVSWSELHRRLSAGPQDGVTIADGGDSPAWTRHRPAYDPPPDRPQRPDGEVTPYAELHCHSNFSFLDGASHPEQLVEEAVRLGLHSLALADHDGLQGVVRMAEAADEYHLPAVFGAELSLELTAPQNGVPDPEGAHLLVLARGKEGYHRLAGAITDAQLDGAEKGKPRYNLEQLAATGDGQLMVLTGCRKGLVPLALCGKDGEKLGVPGFSTAAQRFDAAHGELDRLTALFGHDNVLVELIDHGYPLDHERNEALAALAAEARLPVVATNNVHYATPDRRRLAMAVAAVRARRSLDELDGWLPAAGTAHLRSGAEMAARFARFPGAVARTVQIADELSFPLRSAAPQLPHLDTPPGYDLMGWLRELTWRGAREAYGNPEKPTDTDAYPRLEKELKVIEEKDFPGYFLIVHDIVQFARRNGILCQGRGSAANSAVCYALGITAVDSVRFGLPFERFLSASRNEEPDIDIDIDSDRREEVIQYVYDKYGRRNAAQVANVITYRPRSAVRDMAKALGYSVGQQDAWSKKIDSWYTIPKRDDTAESTEPAEPSSDIDEIPRDVLDLASELLNFPRHLGIHSGGMVLTRQPVGDVCPIEHARMPGRTVLQWDKDDCASMRLVKFDLLGLGMLSALSYCMDLVETHLGEKWTLATIPKEELGVYDQLCRADTVGVFQIESRAQMATLPRLRPRSFYDLVIEIALIRPGPIQGGAIHPYIRRRRGHEPITYQHDSLEPVLKRTLGIPLFQEQLMQIAMAVGGCSGADADLLRRAMGSKRGVEKIGYLKEKLYDGMRDNGITGALADSIYDKIEAFANFGFAESHSISFASLVYASSWLRLHYPGAFLAALLRAQPMGFYSPQSLVADARRHGVEVREPDIQLSGTYAGMEPADLDCDVCPPRTVRLLPTGERRCIDDPILTEGSLTWQPDGDFDSAPHRRDGDFAIRLGLQSVRTIGADLAQRIVDERAARGRFATMSDVVRRTGLTTPQMEALATAGAFRSFDLDRREALWQAGPASRERPEQLAESGSPLDAPTLPQMTDGETSMADLWATGITTQDHPIQYVRQSLDKRGAVPAAMLAKLPTGRRILVGGVVTHRQRPATASGVTFMNLEDETGMVNVVIPVPVWNKYLRVARESSALFIRGMLEKNDGAINLVADKLEPLPINIASMAPTTGLPRMSRDFR